MTSDKEDLSATTAPKPKFWQWRKCTWFQSLVGIGITVAILLLLFGFLAVFLAGDLVNSIIDSKLSYIGGSPDVDSMKSKKSTFAIKHKFTFFSILNPDEFLSDGQKKPKFEEVGPFVYDEYTEGVNVTYSADGNQVKSASKSYFYFNETESFGTDDTPLVILNIPMITALDQSRKDNEGVDRLNGMLIREKQTPFLHWTVRQAVWGAYHPLLDIVNSGSHGQKNDSKFGFYLEKNNTVTMSETFWTGKDDIKKIGQYATFNGSDRITIYSGNCSKISGTDGSRFHPKIVKGEKLAMFNPNFCRLLPLEYKEKTSVSGIPTFRYVPPANVFGTPAENADNACFCPRPRDRECLRQSGLFDVSACSQNAPILMSWPHFFQADKSLLQAVDGISPPTEEKHQFAFYIQPRVGFPLRVTARTQINVRLREYDDKIESAKGLRDFIFPVFWLSVGIDSLDDATVALLKQAVEAPELARNIMAPVLMILGAIILLLAVFFLWKRRKAFYSKAKSVEDEVKPEPVTK